ncbi:hypothetical protein AB0I60_01745 [Actinosynnema sp. NPDC050436]|uniref:hypothetical protein n=1 Tax=Actinosynnema sp. NPDC050436 TaxID=3155659 RepID=UPI0033E8848A
MKHSARGRLLGVLLCVLVAAGCASLAALGDLRNRVQDDGYTSVSVEHNTRNGFDTPAVTAYRTDRQTDDGEAIFRLVRDTYPEEVDRVVVVVNDKVRSATAAELDRVFGPRKVQPSGSSGAGTVIAVVVMVVLFIIGMTAAVVVRRRRRRAQAQPPYPQPYQP